jgi:ribosomal protein S18 acetylase RimI-like enzyme
MDEAPLVRSIMRQAFAEYDGSLAVSSGANAESLAEVETAMREGGAVLAFDDEQGIGSARFSFEPDALYVGRVAVLPTHRRRGVASAMMRFLEDVARHQQRHAIYIAVRESLPSNVQLYQSLGYEVVSIDPHPRGADRVWTMRRQLAPVVREHA